MERERRPPIAKLAYRFTAAGNKVVLGAGDTFRAAAVEQLTVWAERMQAEIVTGRQGSDPASVAYKAVETAKNSGADICIVDTAGRLQTQSNLMPGTGADSSSDREGDSRRSA